MNFRITTKNTDGKVIAVGLRPSRHRDRSKYKPHQSTREKTRRLRQLETPAPPASALCEECGGKGEILDAPGNALDGSSYFDTCPACDGTGNA